MSTLLKLKTSILRDYKYQWPVEEGGNSSAAAWELSSAYPFSMNFMRVGLAGIGRGWTKEQDEKS